MRLVNATPHPVRIWPGGRWENGIEIEPGVNIVRIEESYEQAEPAICSEGSSWIHIPVERKVLGGLVVVDRINAVVLGGFEPEEGNLYVVSAVVLEWVRQHGCDRLRNSVVAPKTVRSYKSAEGRVHAVRGLVRC